MENPLPPCPYSTNCYRVSLTFSAPEERLFDLLDSIIREHKSLWVGKAIEVKRSLHGLRAVYRIGPYLDDVAIAMESVSPTETVVHIRSASRIGYTDYGVNKRRVKRIAKALDAASIT